MKYELVSVIIPVYNTKDYLENCVQSIVKQTYSPIEIIIVDDGSTDGSGELLDSLAEIYPLKVIHKNNGGAASARNLGLEHANGEWIVFIDSDDLCKRHMIERLLEICKSNNCSIACCDVAVNYSEFLEEKEQSDVVVYGRKEAIKLLLEERILSYLHSKIYKRSLFKNLRLPEGITFEDLYIMPEIFLNTNQIAVTTEKLYYYFQERVGNVSSYHSVKHSFDLSLAQRHRYIISKKLRELTQETRQLLLSRAVRASIGAYRRSLFQRKWKKARKEITIFIRNSFWEIQKCKCLGGVYKCIAFVLVLVGDFI